MEKAKILGTGHYMPEKVLSNDDLAQLVDTSDEWITERTGIKERRVARREKEEFPSNMGLWAAQEALKNAGLEANSIDLILFGSCTPDMPLPSTSTILQTKLGITNQCACLDISAACSGFIYGLNMANAYIQTGMGKTVLVVGSEMLTPEVNWKDRSSCILFGDGCGAMVIGQDKDGASEILAGTLGADGTGRDFFKRITAAPSTPIQ